MFIKLKENTYKRTPMGLKPESVQGRGHYTTEDSIKNWPKWNYLLARFFNAVWNKWIAPPPLPYNFMYYVLSFGSQLRCLQASEGILFASQ